MRLADEIKMLTTALQIIQYNTTDEKTREFTIKILQTVVPVNGEVSHEKAELFR